MKMTDTTIRQGVSEPGSFRMNYTITYDKDNAACKVETEIKRKSAEGASDRYIGHAACNVEPFRYTFQLTDSVTAEERRMLADDFEGTIKELAK